MTRKQARVRKRRTFWQPDSPLVQEWLDNQNDLGVSLQLIITEAIQKHGVSDVIASHIEQMISTEVHDAPVTPQRQPVVRPEIAVKPPIITQPEQLVAEVIPAVEPEDVPVMDDVVKEPVAQTNKPIEQPQNKPDAQETTEGSSSDAFSDNYDPIEVMLRDAEDAGGKR